MTTTLPRAKKQRTIPTHYSLHPPRPLAPEKIARLQQKGIEVLTLVCPMLPSVNEKGRLGNRQWYISDEYREKEHAFQAEVTRQVFAANWFVSEHDVYVVHYGFSFKDRTRQDYDNPIKSTQDRLQPPKPTEDEWWSMIDPEKYRVWQQAHPPLPDKRGRLKARKPDKNEVRKLANDVELTNWRVLHPGAIRNDGQVVEASITKHINQPDPRICIITIFKMDYQTYLTLTCEDPLDTRANAFLA